MPPVVASVSSSAVHAFSKRPMTTIALVRGLGVSGDSHAGHTVQHLSRVARDPTQPNLRQVHLIHAELHDELNAAGFSLRPGDLGENITTRGLALLALPAGTLLRIGRSAVIELTGLRNPCQQLDDFQRGLMRAVLSRDAQGNLVRKAGVMSIVVHDGDVSAGDAIRVELPPAPHRALDRV